MQTDLEVKPLPDFSLADLNVGAALRLCADQPVIASAFLDLAQICILRIGLFGARFGAPLDINQENGLLHLLQRR